MIDQICTTLGQRSSAALEQVNLRPVLPDSSIFAWCARRRRKFEIAARDGRTRIGGRSNVEQYACCSHGRLLSAGAQSRCRDAME